ncbi:MAG: hypothetical protein Q4P32_13210 [Micrococcales bacterium]|nr:hypothetical protein [Micrococcales bacterium]
MSPSSLIFVAVVIIWASYLVVHVTRRREHLATARSVDRFSAQMRVLQRRAVRLDPPAESTVRVSSVSKARQRPLVAKATPQQVFIGATGVEPIVRASVLSARPDSVDASGSTADPPSRTPDFFADDPAGRGWPMRLRRPMVGSRAARRLRGFALLAAIVGMVVVALLAIAGSVPAWAVSAPVGVLVAVAFWLRAAARALSAQRRREAVAMGRQREREQAEALEVARQARPSAPVMPVAQELVARSAPVHEQQLVGAGGPGRGRPDSAGSRIAGAQRSGAEVATRRPDPFEVAAQAHLALSAGRLADPLLADREWSPTPVPPPTYTLKARAERPMPPPRDVPVPIEIDEDDIAWDERRQQPRVVSA